MSYINRMKVSFIDKDTMKAVDPLEVEIMNLEGILIAYKVTDNKRLTTEELEIKILENGHR